MKKYEINLDSLVSYLVSKDDEIDYLRKVIKEKEEFIEKIKKEILMLNRCEYDFDNLQIFYNNIERLVKNEIKKFGC